MPWYILSDIQCIWPWRWKGSMKHNDILSNMKQTHSEPGCLQMNINYKNHLPTFNVVGSCVRDGMQPMYFLLYRIMSMWGSIHAPPPICLNVTITFILYP